jgi:imidazolonepropionase-like amidohydrolase
VKPFTFYNILDRYAKWLIVFIHLTIAETNYMRKILFLCLWLPVLVFGQSTPVAFKGALIYTANGEAIQNGVLIVQNGKVLRVGNSATSIPSNAQIIDVTGKVIIPGIVDTHSHLGGPAGGDNSAALNPETRALDAVNPTSDGFKKALAGGITTINLMPGSGHLMSGQTIYVKMRPAVTIEDLLITNERGVYGGLKMANGTNPMRSTPGFPGTRSKSAAMDRELFLKAVDYKKRMDRAGKDSSKLPDRDLKMEPLVEVLQGKRIVHFHTHKANDILTAIRISKEFGFRMVLHHVTEGYIVAKQIAEANIPCSIINIDAPGGKAEAINLWHGNANVLEKAGVLTAIHTDDGITDSRFILRSAAMSVKEGMSHAEAIKALTINGAKMLDLEKSVGSLEPGKDADFVILSGDPFSVYTRVLQTWVEGMKRFDLQNPADKAFAVGGFGVYSPDRGELHQHGDEDHNN